MITTAAPTITRDGFLRFAMRLDAVITAVMGIAGLALAPRIAELSGTTPAFEYAMGAFFVAYGVAVYGLSRMRHVRVPGIAVVIGNVVYAVAAVGMVLAGVFPLTTTGVVATLASGVYTLVMADLQYVGLRRMRA
jgi:glucose uptake protein GlcU